MRGVVVMSLVVMAACGGSAAMAPDAARREVSQLLTLYKENRPKFVVQKQELQDAKSCDRATALRQAADAMAAEAAKDPADTDDVTAIKMELDQAEKACLAK